MKRRASMLLIVCAALLGPTAVASTAVAAPATASLAKGSLLYVQETASSSIERLGNGAYRLRLTGVSPRVSTFTDRPRRRAGSQGLAGFVGSWGVNGFATDPPNAALVLDHAPTSHDVALLTLSHPHYDRARETLTYRATPLRGRDAALSSFARRADPIEAGRLGAASLFIDDGGTASTLITFQVFGESTTGSVQFLVSNSGAWDLSSQSALSIAGTISINGFYATRSTLDMELAPGSPVQISLVVPIELQSYVAPTVEVTNLTGSMTVTWPTASGPQSQSFVVGEPITLNGLVP